MFKKDLKNSLLKIQNDIHKLEHILNILTKYQKERDNLFESILTDLSKITNKDYQTILKTEQANFLMRTNKIWSVKQSFDWLINQFNDVIDKVKF